MGPMILDGTNPNTGATHVVLSCVPQPALECVHLSAKAVVLDLHLPELVSDKGLLHHHVILGALKALYLVLELLPVEASWRAVTGPPRNEIKTNIADFNQDLLCRICSLLLLILAKIV